VDLSVASQRHKVALATAATLRGCKCRDNRPSAHSSSSSLRMGRDNQRGGNRTEPFRALRKTSLIIYGLRVYLTVIFYMQHSRGVPHT
jgi:hypothetical protein